MPVTDLSPVAVVSAAKGVHQPLDPVDRVRYGSTARGSNGKGDALWAKLAGVFQQLRRGGVERLIPADARPARITVPFRSGPFHRVKYPIGTVDQFRRRLTLGTQ